MNFATLRLGKTSVADIRAIDAHAAGVLDVGLSVDVVCTQVPAEFEPGTYVFLWLGSDNSKGIATSWKQGFKAIGQLTGIDRGEKHNDESTSTILIRYIFQEAINRLDILRDASTAYYWCSALPIIGLDDHSNQTVRMIAPDGEQSQIGAFFKALAAVRPEFERDIVYPYPELATLFEYKVRDPHGLDTQGNQQGPLTPEWFNTHGQVFLHLDAEAAAVGNRFLEKYGPNRISELNGIDLLRTIFLNDANKDNLCYCLEFDAAMRDLFGSIKSGTAYKYGLFYSKKHRSWVTGSGKVPKSLSEEEAVELGTQIRDYLLDGAEIILSLGAGRPESLDGYRELYAELNEATGGYINRVWFMKYYHMLAPHLFPPIYSWTAQSTVLNAIGEQPDDNAIVRMGQLTTFIAKCEVSPVVFSRTFWTDYNGEGYTENEVEEPLKPIKYLTGYQTRFPKNRIVFGAPGTGKSYTLNSEKNELIAEGGVCERVTFHPDYSYANFVGTYKPVPVVEEDGSSIITYKFVPGPFMRVYIAALKNSREDTILPHVLLIEEINRANVAAVFGDVFQLLDRSDDGVSEYPICASEDIKAFLAEELGGVPTDYTEISLPDNMFIWATMNSADQGVFPMDTAFKRRWDFTYIGINASESGISGKTVVLGTGANERVVEWNELRKAINDRLSSFKINEDKLLGPYFLSKKIIPSDSDIDREKFVEAFKNKVLMYLFDDAAKQKRPSLFADGVDTTKYSAVCKAFEVDGVFVFCTDISGRFTTIPDRSVGEGEPQ